MAKKGFSAFCLLLMLGLLLAGCADYAEGRIIFRQLHVDVRSAADEPVVGAEIWLKDRSFSPKNMPAVLRKPICISDAAGRCSVKVAYSYGFVAWPWWKWTRRGISRSKRYQLEVQSSGEVLETVSLTTLSRAQIEGVYGTRVTVRLPARPLSAS